MWVMVLSMIEVVNSNHGTATNTESADLKSSPNAEPNGYAKGDTNRSTTTP